MERQHTQDVLEGFFDLIERDNSNIWKELNRSSEMILSGNWKAHLQSVISKYVLSGRFSIMRILFEKATGCSLFSTDQQALSAGYSVAEIGTFSNITIEHAEEMESPELDLYKKLLLRRVEDYNPNYITEAAELIDRLLLLPTGGQKSNLSRDEIIRFGHMVDFSLNDMQFLLLRVLGDNEVGFRYSASMDLIDMFGFITHSQLTEVDALKFWYRSNTDRKRKISYEDKPASCTQDIANSLEQVFTSWAPDTQVDEFKHWMLQKAPYLDVKSKTARRVYLSLAAYAYAFISQFQSAEMMAKVMKVLGENFYDDMERIAQSEEYRASLQRIVFGESNIDVQEVADTLIYENEEFTNGFATRRKNAELSYHVPYAKNGKITVRGPLNINVKKRITDILLDKTVPLKSDILYLIWFIANCWWIGEPASSENKAIRVDDFISASSCLLESALLPGFYPPNVLEETMLLAIALGNDDYSPSMIYEKICSSFTNEGVTKKPVGAKKKSVEQQKEIAEYYFAHEADYLTKTDCTMASAKRFGVSKSSVEGYCRKYRSGKLK